MHRKTFIWMAAVLLLGSALLPARDYQQDSRQLIKTFNVKPGGTLFITGINGDVFISAWDKNIVEVREDLLLSVFTEAEERETMARLRESYSAGDNTIRINGDGWQSRGQRRLTISTPRSFELDIRLYRGDISITGVNGSHTLKSAQGNIKTQSARGNIDARTAAGDLSFVDIDGEVRGKTSGGNVELRNISAAADVKTSGGHILAQNARGDLEAHTSGGRIRLSQIGGMVNARTSGGDIRLEDCSKDAVAHTSGGDIITVNLAGRLDARTSGGDIEIRQVKGSVASQTSGGDITVTGAHESVMAATSAGNIEVNLSDTPLNKDRQVRMQSNVGNLKLTLPAKMPATIEATVHDADSWNRHEIYSDFPLSKTRKGQGKGTIFSAGEINGGGMGIYLETRNGDITIRKK